MRKYIKFMTLILLCLNAFISNGQKNDTLKIKRNSQGIVNFAHFKPNPERKIQDGIEFLKILLNAKTDDDFPLCWRTFAMCA